MVVCTEYLPFVAVVFNVMTFNAVYSLYALQTFHPEHRTALVTVHSRSDRQEAALEKYTARGWSFEQQLRWPDYFSAVENRWIQDSFVWKLKLDCNGINTADDIAWIHPADLTTWHLYQGIWLQAFVASDVFRVAGRLPPITAGDDGVRHLLCSLLNVSAARILAPVVVDGSEG